MRRRTLLIYALIGQSLHNFLAITRAACPRYPSNGKRCTDKDERCNGRCRMISCPRRGETSNFGTYCRPHNKMKIYSWRDSAEHNINSCAPNCNGGTEVESKCNGDPYVPSWTWGQLKCVTGEVVITEKFTPRINPRWQSPGRLRFDNNEITSFQCSESSTFYHPQVASLDLSDNANQREIFRLGNLKCFNKLSTLKVANSKLSKFNVSSLRLPDGILDSIDISNNQVSSLRHNEFSSMHRLTHIDISNNEIQYLSRHIFQGLDSLESLSIEGNKITALSKDAFKGLQNLKELSIKDNPFTTTLSCRRNANYYITDQTVPLVDKRKEDYVSYFACDKCEEEKNGNAVFSCFDGPRKEDGTNHHSPRACPIGHFCTRNDKSEWPCPAGRFNPQPAALWGDQVCLNCSAGRYSSVPGSVTCVHECPAGKYGPGEGMRSSVACVKCKAGNYCSPGSAFETPCPAGRFMARGLASNFFLSDCKLCDAGRYVASTGNVGRDACKKCPTGKMSPRGAASPQQCIVHVLACEEGAGYYRASTLDSSSSKAEIITDSNACLECPQGRFGLDGKHCKVCPTGYIQDQKGSWECKKCPAGKDEPRLCEFVPGMASSQPAPSSFMELRQSPSVILQKSLKQEETTKDESSSIIYLSSTLRFVLYGVLFFLSCCLLAGHRFWCHWCLRVDILFKRTGIRSPPGKGLILGRGKIVRDIPTKLGVSCTFVTMLLGVGLIIQAATEVNEITSIGMQPLDLEYASAVQRNAPKANTQATLKELSALEALNSLQSFGALKVSMTLYGEAISGMQDCETQKLGAIGGEPAGCKVSSDLVQRFDAGNDDGDRLRCVVTWVCHTPRNISGSVRVGLSSIPIESQLVEWRVETTTRYSRGIGRYRTSTRGAFFPKGKKTLLCGDRKDPSSQHIFLTRGLSIVDFEENCSSVGLRQSLTEPALRNCLPDEVSLRDTHSAVIVFSVADYLLVETTSVRFTAYARLALILSILGTAVKVMQVLKRLLQKAVDALYFRWYPTVEDGLPVDIAARNPHLMSAPAGTTVKSQVQASNNLLKDTSRKFQALKDGGSVAGLSEIAAVKETVLHVVCQQSTIIQQQAAEIHEILRLIKQQSRLSAAADGHQSNRKQIVSIELPEMGDAAVSMMLQDGEVGLDSQSVEGIGDAMANIQTENPMHRHEPSQEIAVSTRHGSGHKRTATYVGWTKCLHEGSGRYYYVNDDTGESIWA